MKWMSVSITFCLLSASLLSNISQANTLLSPSIYERLKDQDKDGVIDARDTCPDTPLKSLIDNNGCPSHTVKTLSSELDVHFETGKYNLKPKYYPGLVELGKFLQKNPNTIAIITGHTDDIGDEESNEILSQRRAQSIAKALSEKFKIDIERIVALGYGESRPMYPNETDVERRKNRRVQASVVSKFQAKEIYPKLKWTVWDYKTPGDAFSVKR
ncbi:OmpA family protein [Marinomonas mediterranea]|jgi:Outer membrane protein and related peptidoglycan-associated (lipo)proteins|uniref:OmpA/MotB domain protein n=1 Tax=Marinomonas mediterranea (strain ATCC 700492 / JCM 21426 / NBRC 103028 / MMB-1) TaxID=717774 RepID=F2K1L5_MARM1|nr:OmpA family protein [Marinomonas mediterranea]ADZ92245.1 OmpA/MotB domain protein [Marinomonas mediterranea MMB-1]WCN10202.1 OmpA family protein [Marinomonas mediterranea]WCN14246.1 OmpA family protein [Marinomonas mediterranea]WCN18303.1 OmpA family protein [Marinomonas mediterranea MMB-1]